MPAKDLDHDAVKNALINEIVVEVKSFLNTSFICDLERAVDQYIIFKKRGD